MDLALFRVFLLRHCRCPSVIADACRGHHRTEVSAQLAIDTTLISTLHCDGSARPGTADTDGVALVAARRRKERTNLELVGPRGRARMVVLAGEVGGCWRDDVLLESGGRNSLTFCVRGCSKLGDPNGKQSCHAQPTKRL